MFTTILLSTGVVALAEMEDKTQIAAAVFAVLGIITLLNVTILA